MTRRLKVGLLGVGGVAAKYAVLYGEYPRSDLRIVFDPSADAARAVAGRTGCAVAPDEAAVFAADVDAVVISTPNHLHHAQATAALGAGRHVLLQKPMTRDLAEAEDLVRTAEASGRTLAMYMNSLDNPVIRDIRAMITGGVLGRVGGVNCKLANGMGHVWRNRPADFWRGSRDKVGGGSFAMLATHYVNLAQWLLDRPVTAVSAVARNLMSDHIEGDDIMVALTEFGDGALGVIESAWCVKGEQMSVHGSTGSVAYIDNSVVTMKADAAFEGEAIRYDRPGTRMVFEGLTAPDMGDWRNPHNQHRAFVEAILDGTPVMVPVRRGLQDMRVLAAAYAASEAGRRTTVEPAW